MTHSNALAADCGAWRSPEVIDHGLLRAAGSARTRTRGTAFAAPHPPVARGPSRADDILYMKHSSAREGAMTISTEHLAELLAGIARAQQALVDAIERSDAGWRNTHLIPVLNVAANMRAPEPRLIDLPSRILLRYQGRAAVD